jgi:hypothetical protein
LQGNIPSPIIPKRDYIESINMKIETGADLAAWLDKLEGPGGRPLSRDQAAALLGISRSALFSSLNVGEPVDSPSSSRQAIQPYIIALAQTLDELRAASPARFAALVAKRCPPANGGGRPRIARAVTKHDAK